MNNYFNKHRRIKDELNRIIDKFNAREELAPEEARLLTSYIRAQERDKLAKTIEEYHKVLSEAVEKGKLIL